MSRKSWTVFWLAALLLLFVFNGSLLITDSVESNYALTAKEMVVSGDWLSPQIYGQYWFDKPVFFLLVDGIGVQNIRLYRIRCPFLSVLFWFGRSGAAYLGRKKTF